MYEEIIKVLYREIETNKVANADFSEGWLACVKEVENLLTILKNKA